jgi:carbonic anhydrase
MPAPKTPAPQYHMPRGIAMTYAANQRCTRRLALGRIASGVAAVLLACAGAAFAQPGDRQSPINIESRATVRAAAAAIVPAYQSNASVTVVNTHDPQRVPALDKEWATLRVNVPRGSHIDVNGQRFDLLQFHFHTPAEHAVNRQRAPMEAHFAHLRQGAQPCEPDALLVIGARIRQGGRHRELDKLFGRAALPEDTHAAPLTVPHFNIGAVLPALDPSWRYGGSLTAPSSFTGCALVEGTVEQQLERGQFPGRVSWVVLTRHIEMSSQQIETFKKLFEEGNSRELQPLNQREVIHAVR